MKTSTPARFSVPSGRIVTAFLWLTAVLTAGGCMNYEKPPLAVSSDTYSKLQEKEKTMLPSTLKVLTLDEAQKVALANNPDFRSVQFSIDAARGRYYQSFASYAPTLNASMSINQSFSKMYSSSNSNYPRSQSERYSPGLSGQWLIFDCLAREMNILASKYQLRQTTELSNDAKRLLLRAVAYAYNDVLLAFAQREIVLAQIKYSETMLEDAERKYQAGSALLSDVNNFRVTLKNAKLSLVKIDYTIKANKYVLAGYLGLTDGTLPDSLEFPAADTPENQPLANVEVYIDQAIAGRPDLKAFRDNLQAAKYSYYGTWSSFGPTVSANYSLGYGQTRSIVHGDGSGNSDSGSGSFSYGIDASWNLFNGFADYNRIRTALAQVAEADYQLAAGWISIVTDVRTAYANYFSSIQQAKLAREICLLTKETRDLVDNEYREGTALVTRVNEAESDLVSAQNNLATALVNIANAKAQLDAAVYAEGNLFRNNNNNTPEEKQ